MSTSKAQRERQRANRRSQWTKAKLDHAKQPVNIIGVCEESIVENRDTVHSDPTLVAVVRNLISQQKQRRQSFI